MSGGRHIPCFFFRKENDSMAMRQRAQDLSLLAAQSIPENLLNQSYVQEGDGECVKKIFGLEVFGNRHENKPPFWSVSSSFANSKFFKKCVKPQLAEATTITSGCMEDMQNLYVQCVMGMGRK